MAEATAEATVQEVGQIVKGVGKPQAARLFAEPKVEEVANDEIETTEQATVAATPEEGKKAEAKTEGTEEPKKELDEKVLAFLKEKGLDADQFESMVSKQKESSDKKEEKAKEERVQTERELKAIDLLVSKGGKPADFVNLQKAATQDVEELSKMQIRQELVNSGIKEDKIEEVLKDSFYQYSDDEMEEYYNEGEDMEHGKKLREWGAIQLKTYAANSQKEAQDYLNTLFEVIETEAIQVQTEAKLSSKIDEVFQALPSKVKFDLGEYSLPIEYEVSVEDLNEAKAFVKKGKFTNFLTIDGEPDLVAINELTNMALEAKMLKSAVIKTFLEGQDKATKIHGNTFGFRTPHELGLGGGSKHKKSDGEVHSIGPVERVRRN